MRRASIGALVLALGALGVVMPWPAAQAHSVLVSSDPSDGQRLATLPDRARLTFNEDISPPSYVVVTAPDGSRIDRGEPSVDGPAVRVDLGDGPDGTYALAFRVVSSDGHPVTGRLTFVVGDGPLDPDGPSAAPKNDAADSATSGTSSRAGAPETASTSGSGDGPGLRTVQIAVAVVLLGAAGLLLALSRRRPG